MPQSQDLSTLYASSQLDRTAGIGTGARVLGNPVDILEAVRINDEGAPSGTSSDEVMACVAYYEAEILLPSKVDTGFDMLLLLC